MFACLKVVKNESVICSELCFIGLCNQAWNCIFCNAVFGSETKLLLNYAMPSLTDWAFCCVMDGLTDGDDRNSSLADGHAERASHACLGRENCRAVFSRQLAKLACQARPECSWADEWLYLVLGCGRRADLLSFHFHCISKICGKNMLRDVRSVVLFSFLFFWKFRYPIGGCTIAAVLAQRSVEPHTRHTYFKIDSRYGIFVALERHKTA